MTEIEQISVPISRLYDGQPNEYICDALQIMNAEDIESICSAMNSCLYQLYVYYHISESDVQAELYTKYSNTYPKPSKARVLLEMLSKYQTVNSSLFYLSNSLYKLGQQRVAMNIKNWLDKNSFPRYIKLDESHKSIWLAQVKQRLKSVVMINTPRIYGTGIMIGKQLLLTIYSLFDGMKIENCKVSDCNNNPILLEKILFIDSVLNFTIIKTTTVFDDYFELTPTSCLKYTSRSGVKLKENLDIKIPNLTIFSYVNKDGKYIIQTNCIKGCFPEEKVNSPYISFVSMNRLGSLGGPVFDETGGLIGLHTGDWTQTSESKYYVNYTVPIDKIVDSYLLCGISSSQIPHKTLENLSTKSHLRKFTVKIINLSGIESKMNLVVELNINWSLEKVRNILEGDIDDKFIFLSSKPQTDNITIGEVCSQNDEGFYFYIQKIN